MNKIFFGFGHGFGGTHLLAKLLNSSPKTFCGHEIKYNLSPNGLFDKFLLVYNNKENPDKIIEKERLQLINQILKEKNFGEINGVLTFFIKSLYNFFPNAKFIHMVRDPKKQILSTYNTGIYDYSVYDKEKMWWWPYPNKDDIYYKIWDNLSNLEKCAWDWLLYNKTILDNIIYIPKEQVFFYKFEDMIKGIDFFKLCRFLEIDAPYPSMVKKLISIKHSKTPTVVKTPKTWETLDIDEKIKISNIIGKTSKELGYCVL